MTDLEPPQAFDSAAAGYDDAFTATATGTRQRDRVWRVLDRVLPRSGRFVDLGCGTGEDALWLARRGARSVICCDASAAMLEIARRKVETAGLGDRCSFHALDLTRLGEQPLPVDVPLDGALADFGVLNCLEDRRQVAASVARHLLPGAPFVVVMIGPFCAWEVVWHLLRLEPGKAFRRRRQGREVVVDGGGRVRVWYPGRRTLQREFAPELELVETAGIGVFLPPPYLEPVFLHRLRLLSLLDRIERRLGRMRAWSRIADHVLLVFRRRETR